MGWGLLGVFSLLEVCCDCSRSLVCVLVCWVHWLCAELGELGALSVLGLLDVSTSFGPVDLSNRPNLTPANTCFLDLREGLHEYSIYTQPEIMSCFRLLKTCNDVGGATLFLVVNNIVWH